MRFETPNSMARWDSPLFTVQSDDVMPCKEICEAIFSNQKPRPNMSTQNPPLMSPNFVHETDKILQVRWLEKKVLALDDELILELSNALVL